jgi:hypothetical protein
VSRIDPKRLTHHTGTRRPVQRFEQKAMKALVAVQVSRLYTNHLVS